LQAVAIERPLKIAGMSKYQGKQNAIQRSKRHGYKLVASATRRGEACS
jgi:hypothetical protein